MGGPFVADTHGRYVGGFGSAAGTFGGCVGATAPPLAGAGLLAGTGRVDNVQLSFTAGDSAIVDVRLPPAP